MSASITPQSVQAQIAAAVTNLEATKLSWPQMIARYGADWTKWPTSTEWWKALSTLEQARSDVGQLVVPAPTPNPTPTGSDWAWDAETATIDPNSSSLISSFLNYAHPTSGAYIQMSVGTADAASDSPGYSVSESYGDLDSMLYIPAGTQPGTNDDHHLTIRDTIHGREHDMWHATYDSTTGKITGCEGGASFPLGAVQEIQPGNSNAAGFPLRRGLVTLADVAAGIIAHPLVFSMPNVGPAPARFPALKTEGYPSNTGFPLGTWLRLDPSLNIAGLGLPKFDAMLCIALQAYGAFCRDIGSDSFSFYGQDDGGGGATMSAWEATIPGLYNDLGCPVYKLAAAFPWAHMQVLVAPASSN